MNFESWIPKTPDEYLKEIQKSEKVIRSMYWKSEIIDPNLLRNFDEDSLSDEIIDFKAKLEAVIQE